MLFLAHNNCHDRDAQSLYRYMDLHHTKKHDVHNGKYNDKFLGNKFEQLQLASKK
jgi:hypothetical protein